MGSCMSYGDNEQSYREQLIERYIDLFEQFLPEIAKVTPQRAAPQLYANYLFPQLDNQESCSEHEKAHEMVHSVECLTNMLYRRIQQDAKEKEAQKKAEEERHLLETLTNEIRTMVENTMELENNDNLDGMEEHED